MLSIFFFSLKWEFLKFLNKFKVKRMKLQMFWSQTKQPKEYGSQINKGVAVQFWQPTIFVKTTWENLNLNSMMQRFSIREICVTLQTNHSSHGWTVVEHSLRLGNHKSLHFNGTNTRISWETSQVKCRLVTNTLKTAIWCS